jgi:histidine ammonia-lyase
VTSKSRLLCEDPGPENDDHSRVEEDQPEIVLGCDAISTAQVAEFARSSGMPLGIDVQATDRMDASVALRDKLVATHSPIYGVTTGFGDSARFHISPKQAGVLQRNIIAYHLNGTGPVAPADVVRATMLIRANCLARGYSGIRKEVVELLVECLREDVIPLIPERGSVGASGDLVPLCYLANMLIGDGDVIARGVPAQAGDALREAGLQPAVLEAKEGLALINGTSFMTGFAVLASADATTLAAVTDLCTALATEALMGNRDHFHPLIHAQKPHPGQVRSAGRIRALLSGSRLCTDNAQMLAPNLAVGEMGVIELERPIQDRYSIRCTPHVNGVLLDTLCWVTSWLDIEINSTNDNPLFDAASGDVYNGGNFYGGHVGHAMDSLKLAVASVGDILDRQLALLVDTKFNNGLTPNLAPAPRADADLAIIYHGFKGMQIASSALAAEALKLTNPATAFSRSTESHNQDKVSMGTIAARDARAVVELVREIAAIHLLAACQAADLRGSHQLGRGTRAAYDLVRAHVAYLDSDRRLDGDLATAVELITSGELVKVIDANTPVAADRTAAGV